MYLSGNNLPRISLIRGKLFPDRYLLIPPVDFKCVCYQSRWLSRGNRCDSWVTNPHRNANMFVAFAVHCMFYFSIIYLPY